MISIKLTQFFSLLLLSLSHDFLNYKNINDKALYPRPTPIVPSIRYYEYPIRPRKIKKFRFPMEPKLKRFDVKIYNGDYDIYSPATPQNAGFNMLLAVYCEANNCDMS